MNATVYKVCLFSMIIVCGLTCAHANRINLTVVTDGNSVMSLYERVRNEEPPSSEDPADGDASVRCRICDSITRSGFFRWNFAFPVEIRKIYQKLRQPRYSSIFRQLFARNLGDEVDGLLNSYEYTNNFTSQELQAVDGPNIQLTTRSVGITEHVFMCLMKDIQNNIVPIYVSKEYKIAGERKVFGRFLFKKPRLESRPNHFQVLLAEPAAIVFEQSNFNLELYYLAIRRNRQPVSNNDDDPVCKIMTANLSTNQSYRLCAQVYGSANFKNQIIYPMPWIHYECMQRKVSFSTSQGERKAAGNLYREFMTPCHSRTRGSFRRVTFYISRAYKHNEVFIYTAEESEDGLTRYYLQNRIKNVTVVDELHRSGDVESSTEHGFCEMYSNTYF